MNQKSLSLLLDLLLKEPRFASNLNASGFTYLQHSANTNSISKSFLFRSTLSFCLSLVLILVNPFIPVSFATGGSSPNDFAKVGASWVDVTESEKIYFEPFGQSWDDYGIGYLESGDVCESNSVTVTGPALITENSIGASCVTTFDKIPLPFAMNFLWNNIYRNLYNYERKFDFR